MPMIRNELLGARVRLGITEGRVWGCSRIIIIKFFFVMRCLRWLWSMIFVERLGLFVVLILYVEKG